MEGQEADCNLAGKAGRLTEKETLEQRSRIKKGIKELAK